MAQGAEGDWAAVFAQIDRNRNASVEAKELAELYSSIGRYVPAAAMEPLIGEADDNRDGRLGRSEFIDFYTAPQP